MGLADLLATYSTPETSNGEGGDVYEVAQAMRSLVRRISVHTPSHATVTIANRSEVAS
jgi:hypothetical protein